MTSEVLKLLTSQHTEALDKQLVEQIARAATGNGQGDCDSCCIGRETSTQHPDPPRSPAVMSQWGLGRKLGSPDLRSRALSPFAEQSGVEVPVPEKKGLCSCPGCERSRRGLTFPDRVPPPVPLSQILNPSHPPRLFRSPSTSDLATCPRPPPKRRFPPSTPAPTRWPIAAQSF